MNLKPLVLALSLSGCAVAPSENSSSLPSPAIPPAALSAAQAITAQGLLNHISVLASDEFEGRLPGTPGEEKTVAYLQAQFKALGLQGGNPQDGSYLQAVPLVGINGSPSGHFKAGKTTLNLVPGKDFVASTARFVPEVEVGDSPMVFVGYGIQAPEYGWDDYKGLDVRGKTIVMLINDPPVTLPGSTELDPKIFAGKGMTYYGRWTYKYEIASKLGAAAAIIVHETEPAAYPWNVVQNSWSGEQFELAAADKNATSVAVRSWINLPTATKLLAAAAQDYAALKQAALSPNFMPVALDAKASFAIRNTVRSVQSSNVLARLPGSDPALANQPLFYTAHWDHLGRDTSLKGDQIYNGAVDNASGVAGLLQLAKAFTQLPTAPKRPVIFMAVTAEEQGLLGSRHYAQHPLYPANTTAGDINMDSLNPWGPTREVQVAGSGQNSLEDTLASAAADLGRSVLPDQTPEKGSYYRSDQFELAKVGIPGLYACRGSQLLNDPSGERAKLMKQFTGSDYHRVSDEVNPAWDLTGAALDLQLLFEVGRRVADEAALPEWRVSSEFRARRVAP